MRVRLRQFLLDWAAPVVSVAASAGVALAGAVATRLGPWYEKLRKPSWKPSDRLFGPVWTGIFGTIAASGTLAWRRAETPAERRTVIGLFAGNGALNILWSVLFFTLRRPDWALAEVVPLWLSILALVVALYPISRAASLLLLPYLAWVGFAGFLNRAIVRLNAPFTA
ncbi:MAG TPA: TspO/MBR family protein [Acetobacteraceae bacterium]|nr:TspO/MBR family protein [Acetobacteraceae bacterium]